MSVHRLLALFILLSVAGSVWAADKEVDPVPFVTVRFVKTGDDPSGNGNEVDEIIAVNTHKKRSIRATVAWITVSRQREIDIYLKPGQQKKIAHDQTNVRELRVAQAEFR